MSARLLLIDVDGTLVRTQGLGRRALDRAFAERYGWEEACRDVHWGGTTDPYVMRGVFADHGRSAAEAAAEQETLFALYLQHLAGLLREHRDQCRALPGVARLLARLMDEGRHVLGILTGNIEGGARLKLEACGLPVFWTVSAFGDEAPTREDLLPLALERANAARPQAPLTKAETVIVGDSQRDIDVARAHGARVVAVATGVTPRAALAAGEPDVLFDDLSDLERVLAALAA